jgi:hypothetical protein
MTVTAGAAGLRPAGREDTRPQVAPAGRRRVSLVLVAVLVATGCALVFAVLWTSAGARRAVLAMAVTVPAGQVIQASDVAVVRVSTDPQLAPLPAAQRSRVIGRTATSDLVAGTLLTDAQLGDQSLLAEGEAVVGLALRGARLPTSRLRAGDRVRLVHTWLPEEFPGVAQGGGLGRVVAEGRVFAVEPPDASGIVVVSVRVDERIAPVIAGAAAADRISVMWVPA